MIKCCIFDLDGTLLNTIDTIAYYGNNALESYGFKPIETERYKKFVGNGAEILVRRMLEYYACDDEEIFKNVYKHYNDAYNNDVLYKTDVYEGIRSLLEILKKNGTKIAVLSNKPDFAAKAVVDIFFGKNYFDIVFGQRENVPIKPDPAGAFEIMNLFDVKKEECLYIGDTGVDMKTGKSAGLYTIGALWGFRDKAELDEYGADVVVATPEDIAEIALSK